MPSVDVVILGGGPAGTAAALTFCHYTSLSCVVIEKSDFTAPRIGETLSPGIQGLLRYLKVWDSFMAEGHEPSYGTSATWGSRRLQVRDFLFSPFGSGWHLDRCKFDRMLADATASAGGLVWTNTRVTDCRRDRKGGWCLEVVREGREVKLKSRFVIDATGKQSQFARSAGVRRIMTDHLAGVTGVFAFDGDVPRDALTHIETCSNGWWYSARLPGNAMIAAFMTDSDLIRTNRYGSVDVWQDSLAKTGHTASRLGQGKLAGPLRVHSAHSALLSCTVGEGWLAAGDAAASFDPLSSSGIPRALDSGIQAAVAINSLLCRGNANRLVEYDARLRNSFRMYRETRTRYYNMEQRWPDSIFWQRRHNTASSP